MPLTNSSKRLKPRSILCRVTPGRQLTIGCNCFKHLCPDLTIVREPGADTPLAHLYELPSFLSSNECMEVINAINGALPSSTVTRGGKACRTSRTCYLSQNLPELSSQLDLRFAALLGVDPRLSEPIQGQRYDSG